MKKILFLIGLLIPLVLGGSVYAHYFIIDTGGVCEPALGAIDADLTAGFKEITPDEAIKLQVMKDTQVEWIKTHPKYKYVAPTTVGDYTKTTYEYVMPDGVAGYVLILTKKTPTSTWMMSKNYGPRDDKTHDWFELTK